MQRNSKRKFKAIILAGGNGERFWPLSTARRPKQFLKVFGSESLIRQSVSRVSSLVTPKDTFVIMSKHLVKTTIKELPEIPVANNVVKLMTTPLSDDLRSKVKSLQKKSTDWLQNVLTSGDNI